MRDVRMAAFSARHFRAESADDNLQPLIPIPITNRHTRHDSFYRRLILHSSLRNYPQ